MIKLKISTKLIGLIAIITLITTFSIGVYKKGKLTNDLDISFYIEQNKLDCLKVSYNEISEGNKIFTDKISKLNDLEKASDLIVKGKIKEGTKRENGYGTILTTLHIDKVYKGKSNLDKDEIIIFEPFDININNNFFYSLGGYNLLKDKDEYLLFLKVVKNLDTKPKDIKYIPISTYYGKFNLSRDSTIDLVNKDKLINGEIKYNLVKNSEFITWDKASILTYKRILSEIKQNTIHP